MLELSESKDMKDEELDQPATRRDLLELRAELTSELVTVFSDALDRRTSELRRALDERTSELRRHFDVIAESVKSDFSNLFDWTQATTSTTGAIDRLEDELRKRR